jgi:hypothetical protein
MKTKESFPNLNNSYSKLPLWVRVCLFFIPYKVAYDRGYDSKYVMFYKVFRGQIYILKETYDKN